MRVSIRDVLWATLVVGMGVAWWVSYRATDAKRLEAVEQTQRHRQTLEQARMVMNPMDVLLNWSVLDEPLVEP